MGNESTHGGPRPGAGRPTTGTRIDVRLPERILADLDAMIPIYGSSRAAIIRDIVTTELDRRRHLRDVAELRRRGWTDEAVRDLAQRRLLQGQAPDAEPLAHAVDRMWGILVHEEGVRPLVCVDCGQPIGTEESHAIEDRGPYHGTCPTTRPREDA